jgi:type IV secretion system pilin
MLRKLALTIAAALLLLLLVPAAALAAAKSLNDVFDNVRIWLSGLFAGGATLCLMVGGARYLAAGGDPAQVERAKHAIRAALAGYALVLLAPVLVDLVRRMIG